MSWGYVRKGGRSRRVLVLQFWMGELLGYVTSVASYKDVLARIEASGLKLKVDLDDHLL